MALGSANISFWEAVQLRAAAPRRKQPDRSGALLGRNVLSTRRGRRLALPAASLLCALSLSVTTTTRAEEKSAQGTVKDSTPAKANNQHEAPAASDEVVTVEGELAAPTRLSAAPSVSASRIARERLEQPGITLPDALREAPGVQVSQAGGMGAPATVRVRGATVGQTPIFLDGIRINDEVGGAADLSTVPLHFVETVDIYRSHTPRSLNDDGIGGAVVISSRKLTESEASLQTEVGSFGTRALRGRVGMVDGTRKVLVAAELSAAENNYEYYNTRGTVYVDDDGVPARLPNADSESKNVWLSAENQLGPATVGLLIHHADREQGAPKLALVPTKEARAHFQRSLFAVSTKLPVNGGTLQLSSRAVLGETTLDDPLSELGLLTSHVSTPGERIEQVASLTQALHERFWLSEQLTVSAERLRRYEREQSQAVLELSAKRSSVRAAMSADYHPTDHVHLDATAAYRCFDTGVDTLSLCSEGTFTGRVGARANWSVLEVYGNAGRYQRLPTLSELYGASILVRGNPKLQPETGVTTELGARTAWKTKSGRLALWTDVVGFARFSQDLLTYVRTAQGYLHPLNRDQSRTLGGELSVGSEPALGLELEANVSLMDPRDTSPERTVKNDILPFLSRATAFFRAAYRYYFFELEHLDSASLGARTYVQSSRYADPAGLGVIPGQTFTDLEADISAFSSALCIRGRLSNLFDAERFDVVGFPLPGRSAFLSLEANW